MLVCVYLYAKHIKHTMFTRDGVTNQKGLILWTCHRELEDLGNL